MKNPTKEDFEKAISEGTFIKGGGLNATINHSKAAAACYELAKQMQPKWIPVTERLPEDFWENECVPNRRQFPHISGQHNVCNDIGVGTASYDREKKVWFYGGLTKELGYAVIDRVTHWQPLPEPPTI